MINEDNPRQTVVLIFLERNSLYTLIYVIYMQLNVCLAYQISIYGI